MKRLLFILLLCLTHPAYSQDVIPADWSNITYYDEPNSNGNRNGWGPGGRPRNPIPEPTSYGMFMLGVSLSYALFLRRRPRK